MKALRFVVPMLIGGLIFGGLPLAQAQNPFSTAAIQAWKQSVTVAGYMGAPRYATAALPTCDTNNKGALAFDTTLGGLVVCSGTAYTAAGSSAGPILFSDGTAAAPSMAFSSDADGTGTGFFRSSANNIGVSNNGTETVRFSASSVVTLISTAGQLITTSRGILDWSADGVFKIRNVAGTDFTRLQLGGSTDDHPGIAKSATVSGKSQGIIIEHADGVDPVFADLGAATNGSIIYCSDCTIANPCAGSGTGAIAKRLNGAWVCD